MELLCRLHTQQGQGPHGPWRARGTASHSARVTWVAESQEEQARGQTDGQLTAGRTNRKGEPRRGEQRGARDCSVRGLEMGARNIICKLYLLL